MRIESLSLRQILDSKAEPALQARLETDNGTETAVASAESENLSPSRTEKKLQRLTGEDLNQKEMDERLQRLDESGSLHKGPVQTAVSLAFSNLDQQASNRFPLPVATIVGGGKDPGKTSFREFIVFPVEAESIPEAIETNAEIYREMRDRNRRKIRGMNGKGSLITSMDDEETLRSLKKIAGSHNAALGVNVSGGDLHKDGSYRVDSLRTEHSPSEHLEFMERMIDVFDLSYVQDPFAHNDFRKHAQLSNSTDATIVGGKLFRSSQERIERGIENGACTSAVITPSDAGTVTSVKEAYETARDGGYTPVFSHGHSLPGPGSVSTALRYSFPVIKTGVAGSGADTLNRLSCMWRDTEEPSLASPDIDSN